MTTKEIIQKLNSIQLAIYVHPDRQPDSEFAGIVDELREIISELSDSSLLRSDSSLLRSVFEFFEEIAPPTNRPKRTGAG
jgi:hypothetical protein